jgi:teichuronic acid biosynthesis glycosyltransferase TuaG
MDEPLVSIVTPMFNSEQFIGAVYNSISAQAYFNWEWLVVDDNSTDSSFQIVAAIKKQDERVKLFSNSENLGAGGSRNRAIKQAKGRFIAFLDSDDLWHPDKLKKQLKFMINNQISLSYTQYQKFDATGDLGVVIPPDTVNYNQILYSNVIGCLTAMYDTQNIGKFYMPLIRKRQDMGLWLSILKVIPKAYCLQENLAKYRIDSGMTKNKLSVLMYQWRFYREVVELNIFRSAFTFCVYAYKGFIKSRV